MKIFLTILLVITALFSLFVSIDEAAMLIQDEAMNRAMISFGLAKGLNAVISLIQGTELSITPVGVGLSFSVGEVLDPFNDMVERFSWVMLASTVSLGIQKILLIISGKLFLQIAIIISTTIAISFLWLNSFYKKWYFTFPFKVLLLLIILRFGAVVSIYASEFLYDSVLHIEYEKSTNIILSTQSKLEVIQDDAKRLKDIKSDSSWYESDILKEMGYRYEEIKSKLNISQKLESLQDDITQASTNIINLITIFIIQSIMMPLIFLWLMIISIKAIFRVKIDKSYLGKLNF